MTNPTMHSTTFASRAAGFLLVAGVLVAAGCGRGARAGGPGSSFAVAPCPGAESATRRDTATVVVAIRAEPAPGENAEATVRVQGETERSDVLVNPSVPLTLRLPRGIYDVRVTLPGYVGAGGRMTLTGGCATEMTVGLQKR